MTPGGALGPPPRCTEERAATTTLRKFLEVVVVAALSSLPHGGGLKAPPGTSPTEFLVWWWWLPPLYSVGGDRQSLPGINPSFPFQSFLEYLLQTVSLMAFPSGFSLDMIYFLEGFPLGASFRD